jgi:putative membrane protein
MKVRSTSILAMAAAMAVGGAVLTAQQESQSQQGGQQELTKMQQQGPEVQKQVMQQLQQIRQSPGSDAADKLFVLNTGLSNREEIVLSQQVAEKSQNQQVKQIAQKMIQDHSTMSRQLMQVDQGAQMQPIEGLPPMKLEEIQILTSLPSEQLDQQYIAKMNEAHMHDIACFQTESRLGQNQQVKQFATQTLPILQQHMQAIHQTATQMGIMGKMEEAQPAAAQIPGSGQPQPQQ